MTSLLIVLALVSRPQETAVAPVAGLFAGDADPTGTEEAAAEGGAPDGDPAALAILADSLARRRNAAPAQAEVNPGPSSLSIGLCRLREMEAEPVFFPQLSGIVLAPANLFVEGLSYLATPESITVSGLKVYDRVGSRDDFATIYARTLVKREISFLSDLGGSSLASMNVELGTEEVDRHRFDRLQSRVVLDSFKRAYKERYDLPALDLDTVLNTFSSGSWMDVLVVPAVVSVFAARQGLDRKFHLGEDVRVHLSIEKGTRFYKVMTQDHGGQLAALSVNFFDLPFSPIVTLDSLENGIGVGFIGIGTDLGAVVEAVNGFKGPSERDR